MRRKVARIGPATLMISLPSKWVKRYGIKKGDELDIFEEGKTIKVSTTSSESLKGEINLECDQKFLKLFLNRMYRLGYDEVKIIFNKKSNTKILSEELKYLLGFEVVSSSEKTCLIRNVTATQASEFDAVFNRLFLVVHSLAREGNEQLNEKSLDLDNLTPIEDTVNKLGNLCERMLNKHGHSNPHRTTLLLQQTMMLEQIADSYYRLYKLMLDNKIKLNKEIKKLLKEIEDYYMATYSLFSKFKQSSLKEMYSKRKNLSAKLKQSLKTAKGKELIAISQINVILRLIRDLEVSIVGF